MKKLLYFVVLMMPFAVHAQDALSTSAPVLRSTGPSALEVSRSRYTYEAKKKNQSSKSSLADMDVMWGVNISRNNSFYYGGYNGDGTEKYIANDGVDVIYGSIISKRCVAHAKNGMLELIVYDVGDYHREASLFSALDAYGSYIKTETKEGIGSVTTWADGNTRMDLVHYDNGDVSVFFSPIERP